MSPMKRSTRQHHRPESVGTELKKAEGSLAKDSPIAEVARSLVPKVTLCRWWTKYRLVALAGGRLIDVPTAP